jgi:hypothetical protein
MRHVEGAGCYGHNGADDVAFDAALLAMHQPGHPVRVVWSRADELSQAPMGSAHLVSLRARLNEHGQISHWHHELWANGYSSRPGRSLIPTLLGASQRAKGQPMPLAINPPLAAGGGYDQYARVLARQPAHYARHAGFGYQAGTCHHEHGCVYRWQCKVFTNLGGK